MIKITTENLHRTPIKHLINPCARGGRKKITQVAIKRAEFKWVRGLVITDEEEEL